MAISKIILNGVPQMDLTSDTVEASNLLQNYTAHGADGNAIVGTATAGSSKNTQVVHGETRTNSSTATAIGAELTVSKTGTSDILYMGNTVVY